MESKTQEIPCRLFVILAREAPIGVIFRRGPSKWVQIIKWNTESDTFEFGQWFHGRIYAERSDLSPDGSKLLYMAAKYNRRGDNEIWTAISKIPYLTALAFFPQSSGTWAGGGLFVGNDEIWIDAEPAPGTIFFHDERRPKDLKVIAYPADLSELQRERDGWKNGCKPHLRKPFKLCIRDDQWALQEVKSKTEIPLWGTSWADWDKGGRLVFAKEGKLFVGELNETGGIISREIADFNSHKPEAKESPVWAKIW